MGAYFKPLRRKNGVLTLVLACIATGVLLRGFMIEDIVRVRFSEDTTHEFVFDHQQIKCATIPISGSPTCSLGGPIDRSMFQHFAKERTGRPRTLNHQFIRWGFAGFRVVDFDFGVDSLDFTAWHLSTYSIVIPLTRLSAWLLLSKPRKRPVTIPELINLR